MYKIRLFKISDKDINDIVQILNHVNAIFKYEDGICKVYKSGSYQQYQIQVVPYDITLLSRKIKDIIVASHNQVANWKIQESATEEKFGFISGYTEESVEKDVDLWLYWLEQNNKFDIINICCFVAFKLLTSKHYWENGNKRTSITTLMNLLDSFRFFLSFAGLEPDEIKMRWYEIFQDFLDKSKRKENGSKENFEKLYSEFYKQIFRAIFINAKFII